MSIINSLPDWVFLYTEEHGPCGEGRRFACKDPVRAYRYALLIDKCPRDDTRAAACRSPMGYFYARDVDGCAREDTRQAACEEPKWAYNYARVVDKCPRKDTRQAACRDPEYAYRYAQYAIWRKS